MKTIDEITVYDCKVKNIIALMIEKKRMESAYGNLSCLDYPKEYEFIEELSQEIDNLIRETYGESITSEYNNIFFGDVKDQLDSIAIDAYNNNIDLETCSIDFYDQDDFIAIFVCGDNFSEGQLRVFNSLFKWLDADGRASYLRKNYINGEYGYYSNWMADFVFIVND